MSRTRKGSKGPGREYWGIRSTLPKAGREPGPLTKNWTHRAERREAKQIIDKEQAA